MSSNRLIYDTCAYTKKIDESVSPLQYILNPMKYENCNKCRHELGLVSGPAVSHIQGNLVDLENDLRGATREYSLCPSKKYTPGQNIYAPSVKGCNKTKEVNTNMLHLPLIVRIQFGHSVCVVSNMQSAQIKSLSEPFFRICLMFSKVSLYVFLVLHGRYLKFSKSESIKSITYIKSTSGTSIRGAQISESIPGANAVIGPAFSSILEIIKRFIL